MATEPTPTPGPPTPNATVNDFAGGFTRPEIWAFVPNTSPAQPFYKTAAVMKYDWKDISANPQLTGAVDHLLGQIVQPLAAALKAALPAALAAAGMGYEKADVLAKELAAGVALGLKPGKETGHDAPGGPTLVIGLIPAGELLAAFSNASQPVVAFSNAARLLAASSNATSPPSSDQ